MDYQLPFVHRPSEACFRGPVVHRDDHVAARAGRNRIGGVELTKADEPGGEIQALRERLSKLSAASLRISESLDVNTVLREVVESARALTGAGCSGITTMDASGQLQDFVTSGVSPEEYQRFLNLPHGPGLWEYLRTRLARVVAVMTVQSLTMDGHRSAAASSAPCLCVDALPRMGVFRELLEPSSGPRTTPGARRSAR